MSSCSSRPGNPYRLNVRNYGQPPLLIFRFWLQLQLLSMLQDDQTQTIGFTMPIIQHIRQPFNQRASKLVCRPAIQPAISPASQPAIHPPTQLAFTPHCCPCSGSRSYSYSSSYSIAPCIPPGQEVDKQDMGKGRRAEGKKKEYRRGKTAKIIRTMQPEKEVVPSWTQAGPKSDQLSSSWFQAGPSRLQVEPKLALHAPETVQACSSRDKSTPA